MMSSYCYDNSISNIDKITASNDDPICKDDCDTHNDIAVTSSSSTSSTSHIQQKVLRLEIEDTGCGMSSKQIQQYITEPYSMVKLSDYCMRDNT